MTVLKDKAESILLISCYELGHQPAGIAMPLGFLRREGYDAKTMDVSIEGFQQEAAELAKFIGISVPMHTALRLGVRLAEGIREINPDCHICFYGLYAILNADYLLETVADSVIGGEFEQSLIELVKAIDNGNGGNVVGVRTRERVEGPVLARLDFPVPERGGLPKLEKYAMLENKGERRLVGYVEASRGCLHNCTHCPIPPVYNGRFFVVPRDVVLEDIRRLVATGASHITFGDPDFLNGPGHSMQIVRSMRKEFPELTFDFTAKIEHILKHRSIFPELAGLGCLFVVSAVESFSDQVLGNLKKGHTKKDIKTAFEITRNAGITLRPSFVSFTPWTRLDDYLEMLEFIETEELIDQVDPVQYTIRLLIPPGSLLLSRPDTEEWLGPLLQESFTYEWSHPDPRLDELQRRVSLLVEKAVQKNEDPAVTFFRIKDLACSLTGRELLKRHSPDLSPHRPRPPRLTEAWFC